MNFRLKFEFKKFEGEGVLAIFLDCETSIKILKLYRNKIYKFLKTFSVFFIFFEHEYFFKQKKNLSQISNISGYVLPCCCSIFADFEKLFL